MSKRSSLGWLLAVSLALCFSTAQAQRISYKTRIIAEGFNNPWEMRWGPDNWIYFTERIGRFSKVDPETGEVKVLLVEPATLWWTEAGMLGFDFHPDFPDSPFVYIALVHGTKVEPAFGIFRYRLENDTLTEPQRLFGPIEAYSGHNGSRVRVYDRHLYFTTGEIWRQHLSQLDSSGHGKIHRLELDGSIPEDNPVPGRSWISKGHRNPQGLDFTPEGVLYSSEHGEDTDDEFNRIIPGRNYGWPDVRGVVNYPQEESANNAIKGVEAIGVWTPTIAVGDIEWYTSEAVPEWKNSILMATLKDHSLYHLKLDSAGDRLAMMQRYQIHVDSLGEDAGRLRSICVSPEGRIFLSTGEGWSPQDSVDRIIELMRADTEAMEIVLSLPQDELITNYTSMGFHWQPVAPQAHYLLQIATSPGFDPDSIVLQQEVFSTYFNTDSLALDKRYYWRVKDLGPTGALSAVRSFETRTLSVKQRGDDNSLHVYCHRGAIMLSSKLHIPKVTLVVYDVLGRLVISTEAALSTNVISLGSPPSGVYIVRLMDAHANFSQIVRVE
jgi:aldose sugar dehydrogenase